MKWLYAVIFLQGERNITHLKVEEKEVPGKNTHISYMYITIMHSYKYTRAVIIFIFCGDWKMAIVG